MKKKIVSLFALILALAMVFCACGEAPAVEDGSSEEESSEPESSVEIEVDPIINPLTGEAGYDEAKLKNRPVAVMINNIEVALPQRGISEADIIYELPVEGPITRMMAVFADYNDMSDIGSIRSARHDYIELVLPLDAIYLHIGTSTYAKEAISKYKVNDLDGIAYSNVAFYYDKERAKKKATEHCWFSNAELLKAGIKAKGLGTELEKPLDPLFNFSDTADAAMTETAVSVTVPQSNVCTATFEYNAATGLYEKGEYGVDHVDTNTGKACAVKNVFLMYTKVGLKPNGKHKEVEMNSGHGYYIVNGKMTEVTFEKDDEYGMIRVLNKDGSECEVMPGQTWFCIVPDNFESKLVIK